MSWRGLYLKAFWSWFVLAHWCGLAQIQGRAHALPGVDAAGNSQTVEAALHQMSDRAAVIFAGTVIDVRRSDSSGLAAGVVEIRFDVQQAIRGCSGGTYTLREWGGLWAGNDTRYRVGQRLLMLLHAPGANGLSSPVGGPDGAIPLRASGAGILSGDASAAPSEPVADLRWIGAKLARSVPYKPQTGSGTALPRAALSTSTPPETTPAGAADVPAASSSSSSVPAQEAGLSSIVSMIRSWEASHDASR